MSINEIGSDLIRAFGPKGREASGASGSSESDEPTKVERGDRVEISSAGREMARFAEIRERMDRGFYDDASVAEDVARRLVDSGALSIDA
jgi:hypothetical protein